MIEIQRRNTENDEVGENKQTQKQMDLYDYFLNTQSEGWC